MRHTDVLKAIGEAERFLRAANDYQARYHVLEANSPGMADITQMRERATLGRASLDLTRALAKMRRKG